MPEVYWRAFNFQENSSQDHDNEHNPSAVSGGAFPDFFRFPRGIALDSGSLLWRLKSGPTIFVVFSSGSLNFSASLPRLGRGVKLISMSDIQL